MRRATSAALTVCLLALPTAAGAEGPSAEEIAKKAFEQEFMALSTGVAQVKMTLVNKRGKKRERRIHSKSLKVEGLRRTVVRFLAPPDVQGTSFLLIERKGESDDQYLYLPALKRTRRIAGSQKSGSFMGSDFSYADMESKDVTESTWKKLPDEKIGAADCYHVEAVPKKPEDEDYAKTEHWIHKKTWLPLRVRFYDKKGGKLKKTLFVEEFKKVQGRWLVTRARMKNEKKGSSTLIEMETIDLKAVVPETELTVEALPGG